MAEIISQVFEIDRKLTREEIDSLRECNIINAGGLPGDYRYHLHIDPITDELKKDLADVFSKAEVWGVRGNDELQKMEQ